MGIENILAEYPSKDSKIPLLTEVYQPKVKSDRFSDAATVQAQPVRQDDPTLGITPEFIARVTAHVRPRLEAEITQSVLDTLRDDLKRDLIKELQTELHKTKLSIEASTANFVDKTKADLKTELPRMYQASADLVHASLLDKTAVLQTEAVSKVDRLLTDVMQSSIQAASNEMSAYVEALKTDSTAHIMHDVNQQMQTFQTDLLQQHQAHIATELANAYQITIQAAEQDLRQQIQTMQNDALTQVRNNLNAEMPAIYNVASDEVKANFVAEMTVQTASLRDSFLSTVNGDLPAVQEVLRDNIQQILATALPALEDDLRRQLTSELQELLLKVKFVLP